MHMASEMQKLNSLNVWNKTQLGVPTVCSSQCNAMYIRKAAKSTKCDVESSMQDMHVQVWAEQRANPFLGPTLQIGSEDKQCSLGKEDKQCRGQAACAQRHTNALGALLRPSAVHANQAAPVCAPQDFYKGLPAVGLCMYSNVLVLFWWDRIPIIGIRGASVQY